MRELKLIEVDSEVGLVIPEDVLQLLKVSEGDTLYIADTPNGFRLSPISPDSERLPSSE